MDHLSKLLLAESLDNLAKVLATRPQTTWEDLQPLFNACQTELAADKWSPNHALNTREQLAVLALAKYVHVSGGKFQERLVPYLLKYLFAIPQYTWCLHRPLLQTDHAINIKSVANRELPAESFSYALVKRLLDCASVRTAMQQEIIGAVGDYIRSLMALITAATSTDSSTDQHQQTPMPQLDRSQAAILPSLLGTLRALLSSVRSNWQAQSIRLVLSQMIALLKGDALRKAVEALMAINNGNAGSTTIGLNASSSNNRNSADHLQLIVLHVVRKLFISLGRNSVHSFDDEWRRSAVRVQPLERNAVMRQPVEEARELSWLLFDATCDYMRPVLVGNLANGRKQNRLALAALHNVILGSLLLRQEHSKAFNRMADVLSCCRLDEIVSGIIIDPLLAHACVNGIGMLGAALESLRSSAQSILFGFLTDPSDLFVHLSSDEQMAGCLRHAAATHLAEIIRRAPSASGLNDILVEMMNELVGVGAMGGGSGEALSTDVTMHDYLNRLALLGHLSALCREETVVADAVVPFLISQLHEQLESKFLEASGASAASVVSASSALIDCLSDLAFNHGRDNFQEITDCFCRIVRQFSRNDSASSKANLADNRRLIMRHVLSKQLEIARMIRSLPGLVEPFLEAVILLFIDKAAWLSAKDVLSPDYQAGQLELVKLLQVITDSIGCRSDPSNSASMISLLRSLWAFSILLGTDDNNLWKPNWRDTIAILAKSTPLLVRQDASRYMDSDIESNTLIVASFSGTAACYNLAKIRSTLNSFLPNSAKQLVELPASTCLFLLSVYHVEMLLLADEARLDRIYQYLSLMQSSVTEPIIREMTLVILRAFISKYSEDYSSKSLIKAQAANLILQYPSVSVRMQELILQHLEIFLEAFTFILWDTDTLDLVLEMGQVVYQAYNDELVDEAKYNYVLASGKCRRDIQLLRGHDFRYNLLSNFLTFMAVWLKKAMHRSAGELMGALHHFFSKLRQITSQAALHIGYSIALDICTSSEGCNDLFGVFLNPALKKSSLLSNSARFFDLYGEQMFHKGGVDMLRKYLDSFTLETNLSTMDQMCAAVKLELKSVIACDVAVSETNLYQVFFKSVAVLVADETVDSELLHLLCWAPVNLYTVSSLRAGIDAWTTLIASRADLELRFLNEMVDVWEWAIRRNRGIFSQKYNYGPSKKGKDMENGFTYFQPHLMWIQFLAGHYEMTRGSSESHLAVYTRLVQCIMFRKQQNSNHPLARLCYLKLWGMAWKVMHDKRIRDWHRELTMKTKMYQHLLGVLSLPTAWNSFDPKFVAADIVVLYDIYCMVNQDKDSKDEHPFLKKFKNLKKGGTQAFHALTAGGSGGSGSGSNGTAGNDSMTGAAASSANGSASATGKNSSSANTNAANNDYGIFMSKTSAIQEMQGLAVLIIQLELHRLLNWYNPLDDPGKDVIADTSFRERRPISDSKAKEFIRKLWNISPRLAIQLVLKIPNTAAHGELSRLMDQNPFYCAQFSDAPRYLITPDTIANNSPSFKYLAFWAPVSPIISISFFLSVHPHLIQFGLRSLDSYPVEMILFYVPQIVQTLRADVLGYAEQYIIQMARSSQLFSHQVIWNMNANMYKDDDMLLPDEMKPVYDRVIAGITGALSGVDKEFYEREFKFFEKVTGISGKLKPYIRRSKQEKKAKIDEELSQITVDPGVYLPSNPESIVIDIDYNSGRPLQSHAKAPFMATFKIKKIDSNAPRRTYTRTNTATIDRRQTSFESLYIEDDQTDQLPTGDDGDEEEFQWQSAIFKVGDDCRQDVLALQLIAVFKNIFLNVGLDLYLFPYRIIATAPGCGIIEVVPNSVSRDQMGRANINNLYEWFRAQYGGEDSVAFQRAQDAFIQSLAGYSLILYLLQIKDRHNGNVMIDRDGHMIHIDFGFIFDITPGGIKFELSPFKLTSEMIQIMGGRESKQYRRFVELCIRAFLVSRPYAEPIIQMVRLMLHSGLPCFKGEATIERLRKRFQLDLNEKQAASFMLGLVNSARRSVSTTLYDGYQKLTNGIPY